MTGNFVPLPKVAVLGRYPGAFDRPELQQVTVDGLEVLIQRIQCTFAEEVPSLGLLSVDKEARAFSSTLMITLWKPWPFRKSAKETLATSSETLNKLGVHSLWH